MNIDKYIEWSEEHENILKEWKAKAFVSMWLNTHSSYYYLRINDFFTYSMIITSSISSTLLFISDNNILRLIIAIFSTLLVIITGLLIELCPGQKSEQYISVAKRYTSLIRNIDYCLSVPSYMRENPLVIIERTNEELDNIAESENIIPKRILNIFEKKFGNIDKLLFGDEIIDLIKAEFKQFKNATKLLKNDSLLISLDSNNIKNENISKN